MNRYKIISVGLFAAILTGCDVSVDNSGQTNDVNGVSV